MVDKNCMQSEAEIKQRLIISNTSHEGDQK